jgi:surfactin synthase thioesterase subunit
MSAPAPQPWLRTLSREPWPELRLVCLPHAGGSAAAYAAFPAGLPRGVEVVGVELPGRGTRHDEPPLRSLDAVVMGVAGALAELPARRWAVLGHSLGAIVAFELVRRLRRDGGPAPELLIVAAREGPHLPLARDPVHELPDEGFLTALDHLGGTPPEVLDEPELMAAAMPALRADFAISDTYEHVEGEPLGVPILALGGRDDPDVEPARLEAWEEHTTAGFSSTVLPGGHFFVRQCEPVVLQILARELQPLVALGEAA